MPKFTPTEAKILALLSDGLQHHRSELMACLWDDRTDNATLAVHVYNIRRKLRPVGEDITCELLKRTIFYRHVRLLASATDGRR